MRSRLLLALAVACASLACHKEGSSTQSKKLGRGDVTVPDEERAKFLTPLPKAPEVHVDQEKLPGAGGELAVVAARPQGHVEGLAKPAVTFSKPVMALGMVEDEQKAGAPPIAKIEPALQGEWRWLGSSSVEFEPKGHIPYATQYRVTIFKGLHALDGAELKSDYVFEFTTPGLAVQSTDPYNNFWWMKADQPVKLVFNQPVKESELAAKASFEVQGVGTFRAQVLSRQSIEEERRAEAAKAGRAYQPMGDEKGWENLQTRYVLAPEKPFPLDHLVKLVISKDLVGEEGPMPLGKDEFTYFHTYGPAKWLRAVPCVYAAHCSNGPVALISSNKIDLSTLKDRLEVTPKVKLDWDQTRSDIAYQGKEADTSLAADWQPGTKYHLHVAPGVKDEFGQVTAEGFDADVQLDDLEPSFNLGGQLAMVEANQKPSFPVRVTNLKTLGVSFWRFTPSQAAAWLSHPYYEVGSQKLPAPDVVMNPTLDLKWNRTHSYPLDLVPGLTNKTGLVLVNVTGATRYGSSQWSFTQVTDLAVHTQIAPKQSVAWVTRLSTGEPVADATIDVYGSDGGKLWSGKTGADGIVDIPGAQALNLPKVESWETPFLLVAATSGTDTGIVTDAWAQGIEPYEFGVNSQWVGTQPRPSGFVFADRGIYRPGEPVELKGVLRYRLLDGMQAPSEGSKLKLTVTDERGEKVLEKSVTLNKFGTFHARLPLGKDVSLGTYSVNAAGKVAGGPVEIYGSFRVAEYRAPQFKVDVQPEKDAILSGEPLNAQVYARYLFGGAMSNADVSWSVVKEPASFAPDTATGFTFGPDGWLDHPEAQTGLFASGKGSVSAKGDLAIAAGKAEAHDSPLNYTVEAEVTDVNRQAVAGRKTVLVHPAGLYVGLKGPLGFATAGKQTSVDALVVDTQGKRVSGRAITVEIDQRVWTAIQKKDATGGFTTETTTEDKKVSSCALKSGESPVSCQFTAPGPGLYVARAEVQDDQGRHQKTSTSLYVIGSGWVAWDRSDTDRIDLLPDKKTYNVGDVAHVLVKSPYPHARALFAVEREGVQTRKVLNLEGSANTVDVPITEDMVPNVYVSVLLMHQRTEKGGFETGIDPNRPAVRVGLVQLNVEKGIKRLAVQVMPDRPEYRPGDEVNVDITVKDHGGAPAQAEVTLYAVDEAVLRLTGYQEPDPIAFMFPELPLSVRFGEPTVHLVGARQYGEKGEDEGGGGSDRSAQGTTFRTNFKTTAFYDSVVSGADGKAHVKFKLPDNLTTFRIMAVAVTTEDRFGSGHSSVVVNKPLIALPALPRFARVGDKFEAGVVVHSHGAGAGEVTVTASVEGADLTGPAEQKVEVSETSPKEVRFPFTASRTGTATFRFVVKRADFSDGVEQKIPIELPVAVETVATYGDTKDQRVEGIEPPHDIYPDVGGLNVTLASTALGNFQQGMQQLIDYPYGCLEQQSSRLVPFVALREIAGEFGVAWAGMETKKKEQQHMMNDFFRDFLFRPLDVTSMDDPDQIVKATVKSIEKLQNPDGSFRYWAENDCADSWASSYATLALSRAKDVGYPVDPEVLNNAQAFVAKVAGGECHPCEMFCPVDTQIFASWVLARTGVPKPSTYPNFYADREKLPLFDKAALADAMFIGGGDRTQAKALLQDVLNHGRETPKGIHFEETVEGTYAPRWDSDTRTSGLVLETLTDISPDHPFVSKIAHYLQDVRRGNGQWRDTQEAAFSLMGLVEMVRTKEKDTPDFKAQVALGGQSLVEDAFKGRSLDVKQKSVPVAQLASLSGKSPLKFSKDGTGVLYYSATMRYAPKELPMKSLERGLFVQRWFEPYSGGGQATHFFAGDLVRVRLRVATQQERNWVAFEVPLPAGLEPVDTSLATTAHQAQAKDEESRGEGYDAENGEDQTSGQADETADWRRYANSFWSPFNHSEMRDSKVMFFADHMPPGVHVVSFVARATTPGTFLLKPATGEEMYEPEVFGRSEGGTFEVELPKSVSQR